MVGPRPVVGHVRLQPARLTLVFDVAREELCVFEKTDLIHPPVERGLALPRAITADEDLRVTLSATERQWRLLAKKRAQHLIEVRTHERAEAVDAVHDGAGAEAFLWDRDEFS